MSGPTGGEDAPAIRWIGDEPAFLAEAVRRDVPVRGVCLYGPSHGLQFPIRTGGSRAPLLPGPGRPAVSP